LIARKTNLPKAKPKPKLPPARERFEQALAILLQEYALSMTDDERWMSVTQKLTNEKADLAVENFHLKEQVRKLKSVLATLALEGERRRVLEDLSKGDAK
jgi:hypothetical protein